MPEAAEVQIKLRIPEPLKVWLKVQAASNRRTLVQEIAHRLERSKEVEEAQAQAS